MVNSLEPCKGGLETDGFCTESNCKTKETYCSKVIVTKEDTWLEKRRNEPSNKTPQWIVLGGF